MNHRDHFIAALDANPSDQMTRAIFADWLEEHGDGEADLMLAAGLRWMVANGKWLKDDGWNPNCMWYEPIALVWYDSKPHYHVPAINLKHNMVRWESTTGTYKNYTSRHEAEVALAESLWEAGITRNGVTTHEIVNDDLP